MKKVLFLILPCLFSSACASKMAQGNLAPSIALEVVCDGIVQPNLVTKGHQGSYFLALGKKEKKAEIVQIHNHTSKTLFTGLNRPHAVTFDSRWGRLFVADGGVVRIYRPGKPKQIPQKIQISEALEISAIDYSLMNARAYLVDEKAQKLWLLHPKKEETELLLGPEDFAKIGGGEPRHLSVSEDGKRLYINLFQPATEKKSFATVLATYHLRSKKLEKITSFPGLELDGPNTYRSHFMMGDRATGVVYTLSMRGNRVEKLPSPPFWKGPSIGFFMDLDQAYFLVPEIGKEKGKLVRFKVNVKE